MGRILNLHIVPYSRTCQYNNLCNAITFVSQLVICISYCYLPNQITCTTMCSIVYCQSQMWLCWPVLTVYAKRCIICENRNGLNDVNQRYSYKYKAWKLKVVFVRVQRLTSSFLRVHFCRNLKAAIIQVILL